MSPSTSTERPESVPLDLPPRPLCRTVTTFQLPHGESEACTLETVILARVGDDRTGGFFADHPRDLDELREAGWHPFSVGDISIYFRVKG